MKKLNLLLASTAIALTAGAASAATLSFNGGSTIASVPGNFGPLQDAAGSVASPADLTSPLTAFTNADNVAGEGLIVENTAAGTDTRVTLTYVGFEAGNLNTGGEVSVLGSVFSTATSMAGDKFSFDIAGTFTGPLQISFQTNGEFTTGCSSITNGDFSSGGDGCTLAFSDTFGSTDNVTYAMFGDGLGDSDLDDLVFQVSVAAVPLPAAGWLLLAGLGGMAAMRRKQK